VPTYSQAEEDDILADLCVDLSLPRGTFLEIGVGIGNENNTLALAHRGWHGWWFGDEPIRVSIPDTITFFQAVVTPDNVLDLFAAAGPPAVSPPIDVFSLDIDGNDYWVGEVVIPWLRPRIVIVEYFSSRDDEWILPYTPGYRWSTGLPAGASLAAWVQALPDYHLVATTAAQVNAFFVRRDLT